MFLLYRLIEFIRKLRIPKTVFAYIFFSSFYWVTSNETLIYAENWKRKAKEERKKYIKLSNTCDLIALHRIELIFNSQWIVSHKIGNDFRLFLMCDGIRFWSKSLFFFFNFIYLFIEGWCCSISISRGNVSEIDLKFIDSMNCVVINTQSRSNRNIRANQQDKHVHLTVYQWIPVLMSLKRFVFFF